MKIKDKTHSFFSDFKAFISKGNILDMAVGVIIGGAFSPIVSSLVNDIIMPPLGLLIGGMDFNDLKVTLQEAVMEGEEIIKPAVTINYGSFISKILNFLLIAIVIFIFIRIIVKSKERIALAAQKAKEKAEAKKKAANGETEEEEEAEEAAEEAPVETQEDILRDIRDCLVALKGTKEENKEE